VSKIRICYLFAVVAAVGCASKDNSADTDQASQDLRKAQAAVSQKRDGVSANQTDVERRKRAILKEQQELADQETALERDRLLLGSAQGTLVDARTAYGAAVKARLTKLDASLAGLSTQTDAASRDAAAGLSARRDLLAARLAAIPVSAEPSWTAYTHDVDTTFDAIERDLRAATH
jgi:peptidoglycan hydrolase CwlO-like protein